MSRYRGKAVIANTYDVKYYGPLDTRLLVPTYADLTTESNWTISGYGSIAYNGMLVIVGSNIEDVSKNGLYRLFDADNPSAKDEPDVTNEANWHKVAETSDLATIEERLALLSEELANITCDYELPVADDDTLGGVKIASGSGLNVDDEGNISLDLQDGSVDFATSEEVQALL